MRELEKRPQLQELYRILSEAEGPLTAGQLFHLTCNGQGQEAVSLAAIQNRLTRLDGWLAEAGLSQQIESAELPTDHPSYNRRHRVGYRLVAKNGSESKGD
jgi:hypothetical protein